MLLANAILSALVWPALFYSGAALVSAPILIHLLARRRFKRIRWAAIDFLIDAEKRNRRRVRLEELILLALRCLAVLLIGLLVARPFLEPRGLAAMLGGVERTQRIVVLDDSFSMGYSGETPAGGAAGLSNFERGKRAVRRIIESIRRQAGSDTVTFLRTSALDSPVAAGMYLNTEQVEQLFARLEALTPSEHGLDVDALFQSVRGLLDRLSGAVSATVYVVSDFQRVNWIDRNARAATSQPASGGGSPIAPLASWAAGQRSIKLALVDVGDPHAANLAVTDLGAAQNQPVAGVNGTIKAAVSNFSDGAVSAELHVAVGAMPEVVRDVRDIAAGQTTHVPVDVMFPRAADEAVRAEIAPDALPIDNRRYLSVSVSNAIKLLIVNGESAGLNVADDETALLRTALRPTGAIFSGNDVQTIDDVELESTSLAPFHAVYLCNVYRISARAAEALEAYARAGGGVVIFVGDQIADVALYNEVLFRNGAGLLPARLGEIRQSPPGGVTLTDVDLTHPMVRIFSGADNPFVKRVAFYQFLSCAPAAALDDSASPTDAGSSQPSSVPVQRPAHVIARFNDAERSPAIIERPFGNGRVVLIASSADQEWNDWPKDPSFVVAMLELTQYVARRGDSGTELPVGAPIDLTLDPAEYQPDVLVRLPAYPAEAEVNVTAAPAGDSPGLKLHWDRTEQSGLYQFVLQRRDGGEEVRRLAVNLDPLESDLTHAGEAELRQAMPELPFVYVAGSEGETAGNDDARRELWPAALMGLVAILMSEQSLAWWFGRKHS